MIIKNDFNPRAPCGARQIHAAVARPARQISIHVPLAGHDLYAVARGRAADISIHVPLAGHDPCSKWFLDGHRNFNPRAPCGARHEINVFMSVNINFNPRAPCGARQLRHTGSQWFRHFNPRAPCGARRDGSVYVQCRNIFQSTCPLRGTTLLIPAYCTATVISIHVPLAGHDGGRTRLGRRGLISIHVPLAGHDF